MTAILWWATVAFLIGTGPLVGATRPMTVGEEMEIELSMFIREEEQGKLYKERFNFASHDCGASIVKTNREAKSAGSILNDDKDSYLLNLCGDTQYVIIELCEDILVDEVEISNFEFYSSMFRDVRVSVSDRFPTTNWAKLGEFRAQNLRIQQRFQIENSMIWTKFIKFEVLSHYGDEYYCPMSSVQVFGTTMIEQLKEEEKAGNATEVKDIPQTVPILTNDTLYSQNATFSGVNYQEDCVAGPIVPMDQFLARFRKETEHQCLVEEDPSMSPKPAPQPKDSIYKNINRRLEELERNSTLSLLYQMEQSKAVSEAFVAFESLHLSKFQNLVEELDSTHVSHLNQMAVLSRDVKLKTQLLGRELARASEGALVALETQLRVLWVLVGVLLAANLATMGYIVWGRLAWTAQRPSAKSVDVLGVEFKFGSSTSTSTSIGKGDKAN